MDDLPSSAESEPAAMSRHRMLLVVTAPGIEAEHILPAGREPLLRATAFQVIDLMDPASCEQRIAWWETLVGKGGEGTERAHRPVGFVAEIIGVPVDALHSYRVRFSNGGEVSLRRKEFSLLSAYKTDEKGSAGSARRARPCGRAEAALGYA
jgi:PNKP adenylyltransferase domain, ligase domain